MPDYNETYISSALEDYLEAIYLISNSKASVRITDIALHAE